MGKCGWISIHRKIQDNWVWTDAACLKAWLSIIMEVNHAPKKVLIKGQLVNCERGQSLNSLSKWGEIFGSWSTKRVRTFLKNLETDKMIEIESVRITTRLTVCNYDEYQGDGHAEETQKKREGIAEESQRKRRLPTNNNGNNGNNEKNEKKETPFDIFWKEFGNKTGKIYAEKCFAAAKKKGLPDSGALVAIIKEQKEKRAKLKASGAFVSAWPNPSTWLNQGRWTDEINEPEAPQSPIQDDMYDRFPTD